MTKTLWSYEESCDSYRFRYTYIFMQVLYTTQNDNINMMVYAIFSSEYEKKI